MKTKVRLNFSVKFFKDGELVSYTKRRLKRRIIDDAQVGIWDKALLHVVYDRAKGYDNTAYCYNVEDLVRTLGIFTEKSLLNYISGGLDE